MIDLNEQWGKLTKEQIESILFIHESKQILSLLNQEKPNEKYDEFIAWVKTRTNGEVMAKSITQKDFERLINSEIVGESDISDLIDRLQDDENNDRFWEK